MTREEQTRLRLRLTHLQKENDELRLQLLRHKKAFECLEGVAAQQYFEGNPEEKSLTMADLYEVSNGLNPAEILDGLHDEQILMEAQAPSTDGITWVFKENYHKRSN